MTIQTSFHAASGAAFLGLRIARQGGLEVVYDSGLQDRQVWRVQRVAARGADPHWDDKLSLSEALRAAASAPRVLCRLHSEMKKRAILLESVPH
jgi:hypothetical protein